MQMEQQSMSTADCEPTPAESDPLVRYGCGPIQFSGTDNTFYERRLIFDKVIEPSAATLRDGGDHYMHLADLRSYLEAHGRLVDLYRNWDAWAHTAILNIAVSGRFSSDRSIAEYAAHIWQAAPCSTTFGQARG
jgi:hypothetical protein